MTRPLARLLTVEEAAAALSAAVTVSAIRRGCAP